MKIIADFSSLELAVAKMGAKSREIAISLEEPSFDPIDSKLKRGFTGTLKDVDITENGLLSVEGRQVLLYIEDHGWRATRTLEDGAQGNKFHVSYCDTLEKMKSIGRFEKYVVTNDTSDLFSITGVHSDTQKSIKDFAELKVCKVCLRNLNYKDYSSNKNKVFQGFSLGTFFEHYETYFQHMPSRNAGADNDSVYSKDWESISLQYRNSKNWTCEKCDVDLSEHRGLLHTHHRSGVKSNNSSANLEALCILCHSEEPHHGHMNIKYAEKSLIRSLRKSI